MRSHRGIKQVQDYYNDLEAKGRYALAKMNNAKKKKKNKKEMDNAKIKRGGRKIIKGKKYLTGKKVICDHDSEYEPKNII